MGWLGVQWCRLRGKHKGSVHFFNDTGPFWMCDHCGCIVRED